MPPPLTPHNHHHHHQTQHIHKKEMLAVQSPPLSGHHLIQRPKSGRKPLQPKNRPATPPPSSTPSKSKPINKPNIPPEILLAPVLDYYSNKENVPPSPPLPIYCNSNSTPTPVNKLEPFPVESFDSSLAEELSAIREKLERLKIDKDKTEKMLRERALMLDLQMKEILSRGEVQKQLEIEVDRLYRLNELRLSCMKVSPLRSLRDKEHEKKTKQDQLKANNKTEGTAETKDEFESPSTQSPTSKGNSEN